MTQEPRRDRGEEAACERTWVGHGVAVVAIRLHLHEHGSIARPTVLGSEPDAVAARKHVHTVDLDAGDVVASRVEVLVR